MKDEFVRVCVGLDIYFRIFLMSKLLISPRSHSMSLVGPLGLHVWIAPKVRNVGEKPTKFLLKVVTSERL